MTRMIKKLSILLIDDDFYFREKLKDLLKDQGYIHEASNFLSGKNLINSRKYDLVVIDLGLGEEGKRAGLDLLKEAKIKNHYSVVLTDYDHAELIEEAYELGCEHYLTKDQCERALVHIVKNRREHNTDEIWDQFFKEEFITQDPTIIAEIKSIKDRIHHETPILLLGETGTGKGKIAEMIHQICIKNKIFYETNVSAYQDNLIESEFFGHVKGAFTGANDHKSGILKLAQNGTLFLDEICTMPLIVQKKLLKALEEKVFYPVGSTDPVKTNFRLITATSEDIYQKIQQDLFRVDLFHRINGVTIKIPPLRERKNDIPLLFDYILKKNSRKIVIKNEAMEYLMNYQWKGNVRELLFVAEKLINQTLGIVKVTDLPSYIIKNIDPIVSNNDELSQDNFFSHHLLEFIKENGLDAFLEKMEMESFHHIQELCKGNSLESIKILKLTKSSYYRLLKKAKGPHDQEEI